MPSIVKQYDGLTDDEKSYLKRNIHHVFIIKKARDTAYRETAKIFGYNGRNDQSDAFRHCFWSALLAKELGEKNAKKFTSAHESSPTNAINEKLMDLHNNDIGLNIGKSGGSNTFLSARCLSALTSQELKVIR
ncbi:DUF6973 domain-containing protein [Marinomonas mediterranea]|uniref:DUF6973 domain-containing protein n=1 Tax=Marinomonas mediterranea TaxID=119864 RepID=UPI00234AA428|nr:hypothetical protein [Marinomonas mediterranea]WCN09008.1 hypothetical protein GV055_08770 [Marinomonas mediterranea]WCN13042.1 hypothetical protein GV054_08500 [Marinomonas mediterranea]